MTEWTSVKDKLPDKKEKRYLCYKNGYTVRPVRTKINGKTYEYYVEYTTQSMEPPDQEETK